MQEKTPDWLEIHTGELLGDGLSSEQRVTLDHYASLLKKSIDAIADKYMELRRTQEPPFTMYSTFLGQKLVLKVEEEPGMNTYVVSNIDSPLAPKEDIITDKNFEAIGAKEELSVLLTAAIKKRSFEQHARRQRMRMINRLKFAIVSASIVFPAIALIDMLFGKKF